MLFSSISSNKSAIYTSVHIVHTHMHTQQCNSITSSVLFVVQTLTLATNIHMQYIIICTTYYIRKKYTQLIARNKTGYGTQVFLIK